MGTLLIGLTDVRNAFAGYADQVVARLPGLAMALAVFVIFVLVARVARGSADKALAKATQDPRAGEAWGTIAQYAVLLLGFVAALATAGVDLGAMMVAVGAVGFALAFAMQDTVANFIAGLLLLTNPSFGAGDGVEVGGMQGKVEQVGLRATKLRTFDGLRVEVPNRKVLQEPITVFTYHDSRRFDVAVGIGYDEDIPEALAAVQKAIEGIEGVLADPAPEVLVDALGASSVDLKVRFWVDTAGSSWVQTRGEVTRRVKEALDQGEIDIPYPVRTVYMHTINGEQPPRPDLPS